MKTRLLNHMNKLLLIIWVLAMCCGVQVAEASVTTYNVFERFYEPMTQPSDTIFKGTFDYDTVTHTVSNLKGILSESMTGGATGYPNDTMTWLTLNNQLVSWHDANLGGTFAAAFRNTNTNTFWTGGGGDGWSPQAGIAAGGTFYGFPVHANNPGNAYALIFIPDNPLTPLTQAQIDKLAYADFAPGGMMGAVGMTGTSVAGYGAVGTMDGYPVEQVITYAGPSLLISTLADGAKTSNEVLNITGTAFDTSGVTSLTVNSVDMTSSAARFSSAVRLVPGANSITVIATGSLGNSSTDTRTITYDPAAPPITLSAGPADNSTSNANAVTLTGTVADSSYTVSISINGILFDSIVGPSFSWTVPLSAGINTIAITAVSNTNSAVTNTLKRTVFHDATRPTLAISNPATDILTQNSSIIIEGSIANATAAVYLQISTDTGATWSALSATSDGVTPGTFSSFVTLGPTDGIYPIKIRALRSSDSVELAVTQRNILYSAPANVPPTVTLTAPAIGATFTAPATISLTATAADSDGTVTRVDFYNGATLLGTATTVPYSYSWTGVAAGTYTLTARATDNAGASTTSTAVSVTVSAPVVRTNVALATNGGVATASSSGTYVPANVNNGSRTPAGGYWRDATFNIWPDWVQVTFNGHKAITEIDVITAQNSLTSTTEPTSTMTFTTNGITAFDVQYCPTGTTCTATTGWVTVPGGSVTGNNLVWRTFTFPALTTDRIRVNVNASLANNSRLVELEAYTSGGGTVNQPPVVSLTSPANGATYTAPATISLTATASDPDGTVTKVDFYNGTTLLGTATTAPYSYSWTGVVAGTYILTARATDNAGATTTSTAATVTVSAANNPPTVTLTAPANGATYTAPATISLTAAASDPDGTVSKVDFYNGATLLGTATTAPYSYSWTGVAAGTYTLTAKATDNSGASTTATAAVVTVSTPVVRTNVALASNGGVASASSAGTYVAANVNNGSRTPAGGYWRDATFNTWPDWAQVTFNGQKSITEIDVITAQDSLTSTTEPTSTMTFTTNGITAFDVQYCPTGTTCTATTGWATVPGGSVTGNNLVWRTFTFPAITTDRIRVNVIASLANNSRLVELEAYTSAGGIANQPPTVTLTSPANGATYTAPATISLTATAADSDGTVTKVDFYNGTTLLGTTSTAPYSYSWTGVVAGTYTLTARATDNAGASTTSTAATVTVSAPANVPPTVTLTAPVNGATYTAPATISLAATASDPDGTVSKVDFYNGATLLGTASTAPYSYSWTGVVAGTYILTAKATDNAGATTTSTAATVTISAAVVRTNVALTSNGGVATASSAGTYVAANVNNGSRTPAGGYWRDATYNTWPDWVQVTFNGQKSITEIDVITAQDSLTSTTEPTSTMTFTTNGITGFDVQYWNGTAWVTLQSITGNNLVWRTITFPAVTTDRIRVVVNASLANNSRINEIEVY
jgi:hypothetical protein